MKTCCRYCTAPLAEATETIPEPVLCDFHYDWEAACNLAEDDCCGSTPTSVVMDYMHQWGWSPQGIDAALAVEDADLLELEPPASHCEDFPCCGHESGDCNGQKYGSDEAIKAAVYAQADRDEMYVGLGDFDGGEA